MRRLAPLVTLAVFLFSYVVAAQPRPPGKGAPMAAAEDPKIADAKDHFTRGLALLEQKAWDPALAEFLKSRELFPRASSTENAAICLKELRRYDESLDLYEKVLSEFPDGDTAVRGRAASVASELRRLVGTIVLSGADGAAISVDGRDRGTATGPLRVAAGTRTLRAYKAGHLPFETRVEVAGGQSVPVAVRLQPLGSFGRVRIGEQSGKVVDVLVDNAPVGKTPWEGDLSPGSHLILLRGQGTSGSQPVSVAVAIGQITPVTIKTEDLAAVLRVEPTPAGAAVAIDGVSVGLGVWEGRLRVGEHQIEVTSEGFVRDARTLNLGAGSTQIVALRLERDLTPPGSGDGYHPLVFELVGGIALAPSLGGEVAKSGSQGMGLGPLVQLHGEFHTRFGLTVGLTGGYALLSSKVSGEKTTLTPVGESARSLTVTDARQLRGALLGATAGWRLGEQFPLTLRVGGGVLLGSLADKREATSGGLDVPTQSTSPGATYGFVAPEARLGFRFAAHFEVSLGAEAVLLFGAAPSWDPAKVGQVSIPGVGLASYSKTTLASGTVVAISPTVGVRYDL